MKESILRNIGRCSCGAAYYIGVDGDEDRCDACIAEAELQRDPETTEMVEHIKHSMDADV